MKKKITTILICFLLISSSLPLYSAASETETDTPEAISGSFSTESTEANIAAKIGTPALGSMLHIAENVATELISNYFKIK